MNPDRPQVPPGVVQIRAASGLPDPDTLVGIAIRFQIVQKIHAVSDPHPSPATHLAAETESPTLVEIHAAGAALFQARADEARQLGLPARAWPPTVTGHAHSGHDYKRAAASASIELSLDAAVAEINAWIARATRPDAARMPCPATVAM